MKETKEGWLKSDKGFSMIELIIVMAIMGILSSVLVPSFTDITRKTRLKADIATIQQVQTQIDIYMAEKDGTYPGETDNKDKEKSLEKAIGVLVEEEYIKERDTDDKKAIKLQTKGAKTIYKEAESHLVLDVSDTDDKVKKPAGKLSDKEREWIHGYGK